MEIQNNKEEIPFSYYADLLSKADPAEITARTGIHPVDGTFHVTLLGNEYAITQSPPCLKGKRSAVAEVNASPVDWQSRDRVARRQLSKIFDF